MAIFLFRSIYNRASTEEITNLDDFILRLIWCGAPIWAFFRARVDASGETLVDNRTICLTNRTIFGMMEAGRGKMEISLTELKENLGKYILLAKDEDILLTKNNKVIARLTEPFLERKDKIVRRKIAEELVGSIKSDYMTLDELRAERLAE